MSLLIISNKCYLPETLSKWVTFWSSVISLDTSESNVHSFSITDSYNVSVIENVRSPLSSRYKRKNIIFLFQQLPSVFIRIFFFINISYNEKK